MPTRPNDLPLDEALNHATHIRIVCTCPAIGMMRCGHTTNMKTADLVAKCPDAVTVGDFTRRLKCKNCGAKGWALIKGAGR